MKEISDPQTKLARGRLALQMLLVRLRFPLLVFGLVLLVAGWPWLRHQWDRLTKPGGVIDTSISQDTEYWCPMCPGVLSAWPEKCPVCHMALVRRKKGEATPLPDGVLVRMQLSPYRVQLAGIQTTVVEFRPLAWEVTFGGNVSLMPEPGRLRLAIDVPEPDIAFVRGVVSVEVESEAFPLEKYAARVIDRAQVIAPETRTLRLHVEVEDPRQELKQGMFVTAKLRVRLTHLDAAVRLALEEFRDHVAMELALDSLPAFASPLPGLASLLEASVRQAMHQCGMTLAIPASSVIDTGEHKVVFVETMPGMFDGVEVVLGRRCNGYYPVYRGLKPGQFVVTTGAFLLDAETRLNPSLAASYFGAGRPGRTITPNQDSSERLSREDQQRIALQKVCPVMGEPLGSMGPPVRVVLEGKPVFLCCRGCEGALRRDPRKYLAKIAGK